MDGEGLLMKKKSCSFQTIFFEIIRIFSFLRSSFAPEQTRTAGRPYHLFSGSSLCQCGLALMSLDDYRNFRV